MYNIDSVKSYIRFTIGLIDEFKTQYSSKSYTNPSSLQKVQTFFPHLNNLNSIRYNLIFFVKLPEQCLLRL